MTWTDFVGKVRAIVSQHWHVLLAAVIGFAVGKGWIL